MSPAVTHKRNLVSHMHSVGVDGYEVGSVKNGRNRATNGYAGSCVANGDKVTVGIAKHREGRTSNRAWGGQRRLEEIGVTARKFHLVSI